MLKRDQVIADVFGRDIADRPLASEPLSSDDWRRVLEAKRNFTAAVRQIVVEARLRKETTTEQSV